MNMCEIQPEDYLQFLYSRRSIRKYQDRDIIDEAVDNILKAGMAAPSACGKDPWRFIVIRKKETLKAVSEGMPSGAMLADAPLGFVVCGDMEAAHDNQLSFMLQDCSAAIENMLLAIQAMGLGACWLGVHPREDRIAHIRSLFSIPDSVVPVCCIAVGYPDENKESRTRFNSSFVHNETW
jgi:nitroreductase